MKEKEKITIGFSFTDTFGNNYSATTNVSVFHNLGETELLRIFEQLNIFLRQCGYCRKNDFIFERDVTEAEYYALAGHLEELRKKGKE